MSEYSNFFLSCLSSSLDDLGEHFLNVGVGHMVQRVKVIFSKSDNLSSIPSPHKVEGGTTPAVL